MFMVGDKVTVIIPADRGVFPSFTYDMDSFIGRQLHINRLWESKGEILCTFRETSEWNWNIKWLRRLANNEVSNSDLV